MTDDPRNRIIKPQPTLKQSTLLLGPSGVGKTFQCGTLISGGWKTLYASVEKKAATIEALSPDIWPIDVCDYPRNSTEANATKDDLYAMVRWLREPGHGYDAVCLDSGMRYADELAKALKGRLTGYDMWGAFGDKLDAALTHLTKLTSPEVAKEPVHVVITWGVEVSIDGIKNKRMWQPLIDGKRMSPRIPYLFDNVLVLMRDEDADKGKVDYVAYTAGTGEFDAKVSSRVKVQTRIVNPNLYQLLTTITGGSK